MSKLQSVTRLVRRWIVSIPFFIVLGLILGGLISVAVIPKPAIATITISGEILGQDYADDVLDALKYARDESSIKAVVLQIDSPGGGASATEQIYLDLLRLRQQKPVVVSIGTMGASGGYYIAVAGNFIYTGPTSLVGSVGAWVGLPRPEELEEDVITSGPFKATGSSRRRWIGVLETFREQFVSAVVLQRGERLKLSKEELSRAEIYSGTESLRYGLIDDIGTSTDAIAKAASLAGIRNYAVTELRISPPFLWLFLASDLENLKSRASTVPIYYYLYFESE